MGCHINGNRFFRGIELGDKQKKSAYQVGIRKETIK
jgi:hypothetical protein